MANQFEVTDIRSRKLYQVARFDGPKAPAEGACYGGIYFANHFRVDKSIDLEGISFFGPLKPERALFFVDIKVAHVFGTGLTRELVLYRGQRTVEGKKGEEFKVPFKEPISIRPGEWIRIQFDLGDGCPKTNFGDVDKGPTEFEVKVASGKGEEEVEDAVVTFNFLRGSKQMSKLFFYVA